jgi:hypothetical protein
LANEMTIGNYSVTRDPRGLRLRRTAEARRGSVPLLLFNVSIPQRLPTAIQIERIAPNKDGVIEFAGSWTDRLSIEGSLNAAPEVDGIEVTLRLIAAGSDLLLRFGAQLELTNEADPRWMVPGVLYRDNRAPGNARLFPTFHQFTRDPRRFVSSYWSFRSDRATLPAVFVWTYGTLGFISTSEVFGVSQDHPEGAGMTSIALAMEDGNPRIGVEFPYREAPVKYSFCHEDLIEPEETFLHLPARTPLTVTFLVGTAAPDLHGYAPVMKGLYARSARLHPTKAKLASEEAETCAHMGLLRWHYEPRHAAIYETAVFERQFGRNGGYHERTHMHAGWLSGAMPAYTLLWGGRDANHEPSINAGIVVLDKITSELSPAGTLFPVWTEEFGWSSSFGPEDGTAHSRTVAEACLFICRALRLELRHSATHLRWLEALDATLNYAMAAQREDGAFPSYFDLTTGRPTAFDGAGGLPWIAAIAASSSLLHRPHLREVLTKAGRYYGQMLHDEFLTGTVEDQPATPCADDAHWALISFLLLYEFDHDVQWLNLARKAADLACTWRFAYNVSFSRATMLGRHELRTRGADVVSAATPVSSALGLISYGEMLKLSALTGDRYYRERAEDARAFATQLVAAEDGELNARLGMVAAEICHTDWMQPKGRISTISAAYMAALVRHTELVRRSLQMPLEALEGLGNDPMFRELALTPTLYADAALSAEKDDEGPGLGDLLPSFGGMMGGGAKPGANATPLPIPQRDMMTPVMGVSPDSSGMIPLSGFMRVPTQQLQMPDSAQLRGLSGQPSEAPPEAAPEEPEIKYKIF